MKTTLFKHGILPYVITVMIIILGTSSAAIAQVSADSELAPLNPDFLHCLQDVRVGKLQKYTAIERGLGYIPPPLDLSHMKGRNIFKTFQPLGYPASYDLRTQGKLTSVRDQGSCGSCWTFATYGSLESYLLTGETWNFSENNLKNTHDFDIEHCSGGNHLMSTAYLVRWSGPVSESDDPYNPNSDFSPLGLTEEKHVQDVFFLPGRADPFDNDNIKQAVMTYGAVYTSMYWDSLYWDGTNDSYYYSGTKASNHAVAIVGWDDNFAKTKFRSPYPPDNGAFIIKNSWGTGFGENGYFYISYYDSKIGEENVVFTAEQTTNYDTIYQYDPLGWVMSLGYGSNTAWFANIFTSSSNQPLVAVSFYIASPQSTYEIYIYTDVTPGQPRSGTLAGSKSGTISSAGYHTIALDSAVPLTLDQAFSVVVKLTTPGYNYPIPLEYPYPDYSTTASADAGESYVSFSGNSWDDITSSYPNTNVCIKAFATAEVITYYTLSVNKSGAGSGTVASSPSGINCGGDCSESYDPGTVVTLTANPEAGSTFTSWTGGGCSGNGVCVVTMNADTTVTATFISLSPDISISPTSHEFGSVNIGATSAAQTFTISNVGAKDLTIGTINITGTNASAFGKQSDNCSGQSLASSADCTVQVVFSPSSDDAKSATLNISSNDPDTSNLMVPLSGTGIYKEVTLLKPNGGEVIPSGSMYSITWGAPAEAVKFKLKYSRNNGRTWKLITKDITGTSYEWTVPTPLENKRECLVKVVAYNSSNIMIGKDISDAPFTIEVVRVTLPNEGDTLTSGEEHPITWITNVPKREVTKVKLYYKKNGGANWKLITTLTGNPGIYNWTIPSVETTKPNCKVKVILKDSMNEIVGQDISDGYFTTHPL